jgi:DNA-binding NtrC family response regulator
VKEKILILDDELDMLTLLQTIITGRTDHEVLVSNNPLELEELMATFRPDIVISDLKMLGRDGLEVIKLVHEIDETIPVVIITAYGSLESAQEAVAQGAYDYITTPFRKEEVLVSIGRALDLRRLKQETLSNRGPGA